MAWLVYIFYGLISGLGQVFPVSVGAHDFFLKFMANFDVDQPFLQLSVDLAALGALILFFRHRIAHIYREMRIASLPARRRMRQPDLVAVLDGRVVLTMLLPAALGLFLTGTITRRYESLPLVSLLLLISAIVIYIPHFLQGANRDSRHLSRLEAVSYGVLAGLSAFPGISRVGMVISVGSARGCGRRYMLDVVCLLLALLLVLQVVVDLFGVIAVASALTGLRLVYCLLAAAASFGGTCFAIAAMRFLTVNRGYTAFSYYNLGLSIFGFILYLMI